MNHRPRAYRRDGERLAEKLEALTSELKGSPDNVVRMRRIAREIGEFLRRWRGQVPGEEKALSLFATQLGNLESRLERHWLISLRDVLEKRRDCFIGEKLLSATGTFAELMKHTHPEIRVELEKIHRESLKTESEYNAETDYREMEMSLDETEEEYQKELAEFLNDWGDRAEGAVIERLKTLNIDHLNTWAEEVRCALEKLRLPGM